MYDAAAPISPNETGASGTTSLRHHGRYLFSLVQRNQATIAFLRIGSRKGASAIGTNQVAAKPTDTTTKQNTSAFVCARRIREVRESVSCASLVAPKEPYNYKIKEITSFHSYISKGTPNNSAIGDSQSACSIAFSVAHNPLSKPRDWCPNIRFEGSSRFAPTFETGCDSAPCVSAFGGPQCFGHVPHYSRINRLRVNDSILR
jgi:hypothetical protein